MINIGICLALMIGSEQDIVFTIFSLVYLLTNITNKTLSSQTRNLVY